MFGYIIFFSYLCIKSNNMKQHKILNHPKTGIPYMVSSDAIKGLNTSFANKETNDCAVRAMAAVTGSKYIDAHKYVETTFGRPKGKGTPMFDHIMKKNEGKKVLGTTYKRMTNHTETTYIKKRRVYDVLDEDTNKWGYKLTPGSMVTIRSTHMPLITTYGKTRLSRMTVKTFLKEYPKGKYLIHVRSHAFAILDGVVVGNLCDSRRLKAQIINAYKFN